jgi:hypothetical protein
MSADILISKKQKNFWEYIELSVTYTFGVIGITIFFGTILAMTLNGAVLFQGFVISKALVYILVLSVSFISMLLLFGRSIQDSPYLRLDKDMVKVAQRNRNTVVKYSEVKSFDFSTSLRSSRTSGYSVNLRIILNKRISILGLKLNDSIIVSAIDRWNFCNSYDLISRYATENNLPLNIQKDFHHPSVKVYIFGLIKVLCC